MGPIPCQNGIGKRGFSASVKKGPQHDDFALPNQPLIMAGGYLGISPVRSLIPPNRRALRDGAVSHSYATFRILKSDESGADKKL